MTLEALAISDEEMASADKALATAIDNFGKSALRVRDERDHAIRVIDTLIANMAMQLRTLPLSEGNQEAGAFATHAAHWLDYARDERSRLP